MRRYRLNRKSFFPRGRQPHFLARKVCFAGNWRKDCGRGKAVTHPRPDYRRGVASRLMSAEVWFVRVRLSDGAIRDIAAGDVPLDEVVERFTKGKSPFDSDWLDTTTASAVRRDAVIEFSVVPG